MGLTEEQFKEASWSSIEPKLEEDLLENLHTIFKSVVKKIMSYGYEEEVAILSILRTEFSFGTKDTVTSIVDNAVLYLKSGIGFDYFVKEELLEDLNEREISTLNEMIGVVKDFRPSSCRGEALRRLLVSDLNVIRACSINPSVSSASRVEKEHKGFKANIQTNPESYSLGSHKPIHYERRYATAGSKASKRTPKHNSLNGLLSHRLSETFPDPNALNMKDTTVKVNQAPADKYIKNSFEDMTMEMTDNANTELFLSSPSGSGDDNVIILDKMDKALQTLSAYEKELVVVKEEWNEWAQHKVMDAARRLGEIRHELQSLRQEKEKVTRLKNERQNLEENKFSEIKMAYFNALNQLEKYFNETRNKERENIKLKEKLAALKLQAADSAASFRENSKKKRTDDTDVRSQLRERSLLQEELATEKNKSSQLKQQLEQAKEHYNQLEARWKRQEKVKQELLDQYNILRKEQDRIEVSGRSKENEMRLKAETELQRHKDETRKLEMQILHLRQKTDPSKIAVLNNRNGDPKIAGKNVVHKPFELEDEDVDREKECVMCLREEMSVLFLPCRHLVVCEACNEALEKRANKDCPSCRTSIEKRIIVRTS